MKTQNDNYRRTRILIADENAFNRNIVTEILRGAGLDNLLCAKDGAEMMQMTIEFAPQIVIANSRLPGVSGLEFTRKIRAGYAGAKRNMSIIVATSTATTKFLEAARASGVDEMLVRPFTAAALLARVEAVLLRPRRFIDSVSYVGPCRRRRMLEDYDGPMRRFCDPLEAPGEAPWEAETNRDLMRQAVAKIDARARRIAFGDRSQVHQTYLAVVEAEELADEVRDERMTEATRSLGRYITAIGASGGFDHEVLTTHLDAMQKLCALGAGEHAERLRLVAGLHAVVDKKLGRTQTAA